MSTKHQYFVLDKRLMSGYPKVVREAIALDVIREIQKRTESGKDKTGKSFPKYSKEYMDSLNFKIAGKSSNVDLTLTGDMLASIALLKNQGTEVRIGFEKGSVENAKADGNIRGTYGQPKPNSKLARDFLGLTQAELKKILEKYPKKDLEAATDAAEKRIATADTASQGTEDVETEL